MRLRRVVAAAALVSAPACSLVLDANVHDPDAVAASPDGDAGTSTGKDGGGVVDGDAAGGGEAGNPDGSTPSLKKGCAFDPPRRFCEDFEDGELAPTWDFNKSSASTIDYDSLAFGGGRAAKMAMTGAPSCSFARLDKNWEDTKATTRVETHFKVRPSSTATSANGEVNLAAFQIDELGGSKTCTAIVSVSPAEVAVAIQTPPTYQDERHVVGGTLPFDKWTEVGLEFASGSPTSMVVTVQTEGGAIDETSFPAPQCPPLGGAVRLGVGLHCETGTAEARYDDVWLDWR